MIDDMKFEKLVHKTTDQESNNELQLGIFEAASDIMEVVAHLKKIQEYSLTCSTLDDSHTVMLTVRWIGKPFTRARA